MNNVQKITNLQISNELSERIQKLYTGWGGETLGEFATRLTEMGCKQIEYRKGNSNKQAARRKVEREQLREYKEMKARLQKDPDLAIKLNVLDAKRGEVGGEAVHFNVLNGK